MIYTIGRTRDYLMALICKEVCGQRLEKLGRRQIALEECFFGTPYYMKPFPGGSVWATREEAQRYIESRNLYRFAVFGVEASWDQTAEAWDPEAAGWRDLLIDAPVLRLEAEYYKKCVKQEAQMRRRFPPQPFRPPPNPDDAFRNHRSNGSQDVLEREGPNLHHSDT